MISNQCRAQCRCSYCKNSPANFQRTLAVDGKKFPVCANKSTVGSLNLSKDEMYRKYLELTLNDRALMDSSKNIGKFIPDEQIVSSIRRRLDKEIAVASEQFPLRRRDRLQELLILEHKSKLKEQARLLEERLKNGLLEDPTKEGLDGAACDLAKDASTQVSIIPDSRSLADASKPPSRCSAEHDLSTTLREIKDILKEESGAPAGKEMSDHNIFKLHQILRNHDKKSRAQQERCTRRPHLCKHCFDVDVQGRHLCPNPSVDSVAYAETGKVINPEEGISFGTATERGSGETYTPNDAARFLASNSPLEDYNPHPYGSGVVVLPVSAAGNFKDTKLKSNGRQVKFEPTFNNNISPGQPVPGEFQFPGSTYNVYDHCTLAGKIHNDAPDTSGPKKGEIDSAHDTTLRGNHTQPQDTPCHVSTHESKPECKSSAYYWRTTNQVRDMDMERFLTFQKMLKENSRKVYDSTAPRNTVATDMH